MSENTVIIYVAVKYSRKPDLYPVRAIHEGEDCYRIVEVNPDSEHLYWEFGQGDIVKCEEHLFAENEIGLIARAKCEMF